jgi:uncharacterized protein YijF (DUF1287 family)
MGGSAAAETNGKSFKKGDRVAWNKSDDDVPEGSIGVVVKTKHQFTKGKVEVVFAKGTFITFNFSTQALILASSAFEVGDRVTWSKSDEDVPEGTIGFIVSVKDQKEGKVQVRFGANKWNMWAETLALVNSEVTNFKAGDFVTWKKSDADVPDGTVGVIMQVHEQAGKQGDGKLRVAFPKGTWNFAAIAFNPAPRAHPKFAVGDHVVWTKEDPEVPAGTIGLVKSISQQDKLGKIKVKFPKGSWDFAVVCLQLASVDLDGGGNELDFTARGASEALSARSSDEDASNKDFLAPENLKQIIERRKSDVMAQQAQENVQVIRLLAETGAIDCTYRNEGEALEANKMPTIKFCMLLATGDVYNGKYRFVRQSAVGANSQLQPLPISVSR